MGVVRFVTRFRQADEGVTAVEFAVVAPVFILLLMGIIEFALIMLVYNVMESATSVSARLGSTGYATGGVTREQTIINSIKDHGGSLVDASKITITMKSYGQYDQINDPEPYTDANHNGAHDAGEPYTDVNGNGVWDADMGRSGAGSTGDIVVYTVTYPWKVSTPIVSTIIGGTVNITTHAVTKNEPF